MSKIKAVIFDLWDTLIPATIDFVHLKALTEKEDSASNQAEIKGRGKEGITSSEASEIDDIMGKVPL